MASEKEKKRMLEIDRENEIEVEVGKARLFNSTIAAATGAVAIGALA